MQPGIAGNALADRRHGGQCNVPRIPTGRYPAYSTTLFGIFNAAGKVTLFYKAKRDTLFIGMSVFTDPRTTDQATTYVDAEYCSIKYLVHSAARAWSKCCDRKPVFAVGVNETKKLEFQLSGGTPEAPVLINLHGFQGKGCCG